MKKSIFFAYEFGHQDIKDSICKGIKEYNSHQSTYEAISWEDLDNSGHLLNATILRAIDNCDIFACDLTYINMNVIFELGYAIAKRKSISVVLNPSIKDSTERYSSFKFLKQIRYKEYTNYKGILTILDSMKSEAPLGDMIPKLKSSDYLNEVFYFTPKQKTAASLELLDLLTKDGYEKVVDDVSEVAYQPMKWYFNNICYSLAVVVHLMSYERKNSIEHNSEASFYAGIALGLQKEVLFLAEKPFVRAPMDYEDLIIEYLSAEDCALLCIDWLKPKVTKYRIHKNTKKDLSNNFGKKSNLILLGLGGEVAENEKDELMNYFVEIEAYKRILQKDISIVTGRKGSGKSALFLKLESDILSDETNYCIIIKPETEEIFEKLNELTFLENESKRFALLKVIWKITIFNKLIESIEKKIQAKVINLTNYNCSELEFEIIEFCSKNKKYISKNYFGVLLELSLKYEISDISKDATSIQKIFNEYMNECNNLIKRYFSNNEYAKIYILADNLDRAWQRKYNLHLQAESITSLFEYLSQFNSEIKNFSHRINIKSTILLRKDIYDYILRITSEPDKITVHNFEINWEAHKGLLKEVVDRRFCYKLGIEYDDENIKNLWKTYFDYSIDDAENSWKFILDNVISRPRDVIYFIGKLFESAVDNSHDKIKFIDFEYAKEQYFHFLNSNMVSEMKEEYPFLFDMISHISILPNPSEIKVSELLSIFNYLNNSYDVDFDNFLKSLFTKQYIYAVIKSQNNRVVRGYNEFMVASAKKRFLFMNHDIRIRFTSFSQR
jgi:hypothetical protein